ncbi:threonine--tRNA ligase [Thalassobacillus hwangdonensis]|uniref:Threonine--tRNA ligase n=1 Tax=Thalassobacillus hwangdonensis TaxID=546108 RepID=A0ABW3KZ38_9BACI
MSEKRINVVFPDGNVKEFEHGISVEEIAQLISPSLKKKSIAGKVDGVLVDMSYQLQKDANIELIARDSAVGEEVMRHTAAHVLAQAVKRLYPSVKLGVGPVIENGFYYDLDLPESIGIEDLVKLEKEMKKIIEENHKVMRKELSLEEAEALFEEDPLKLELLADIPEGESLSIYEQGEFIDLCRGPHAPSTGVIKAFKLMNVSGAYWRGDSENQMLQRVYGVAFASQQGLEEYLHFREEAEKRDHRKLGKALELFMFSEEAPGMPFYLANGQIVRNELEAYLRGLQQKHGYEEVRTPLMMNKRLWEQSGHWSHYKDNMYFTDVDEVEYALKPMNCPGHMLIFKDKLHSYRDLPLRMAEFGQVHRHEFSGALNGMTRVRTFCQDDAHIFVAPNQIESEIEAAIALIDEVYGVIGFDYELELSTRPEDSMGEDHLWEQAEASLKRVLDKLGYNYRINEGDGAFYGPKIDFHIKDALKRSHQCATIQLDFQMPEKFDLSYVDENNEKVRPVVIHRAVFGSIDRFFGILVEHFAGAFPAWLAPFQVKVIPVSNQVHLDYAEKVKEQLLNAGIRVEVDHREEKLGYRMREAQMKKVPYILVVGDEEMKNHSVNVRKYGSEVSNQVSSDSFIASIKEEILLKKLQ